MRLYITCLLSIICLHLAGQSDNYESYDLPKEVDTKYMPQQDNEVLKQVELRSRKKGRPNCFAKNLELGVTPDLVGTWDYTFNNMAVWRYKIISKSAETLNLGFTEYVMPAQGKMYLYGQGKNQILGPFTKSDNEDHRQLWTPVVEGEEITIEIQIPIEHISDLKLKLEYVNHDFMNILKSGSNSSSGSCNVDVACGAEDGFPIIDTKRDIINSVGAFTLNGTEQCSGVLVNNSRNDCTPYFLTANHCEVSTGNAASVVVYWNYQNSNCRAPETVESGNDGDGSLEQFTTGSTFLAGYAPSDFTLLLLDDMVSPEFSPYFAGWNIGRALPDTSVCIHHPNVEEKRISIDFDPNDISVDNAGDTFIRVNSWDFGTTEKGSSGAPLFNNNNEIIGLLNGGQATCINEEFDEFGPMFLSWEGGGTKDTRLKDWLDPDNLGLNSLAGKNCTFILQLDETVVEVCGENTDARTVNFNLNENFENETTISFGTLPEGLGIELANEKVAPGTSGSFTISNFNALSPDVYQIEVNANDGKNSVISNLTLKVFDSNAASISLVSPKNGEDGLLTNVILEWETVSEDMDIEIAVDDDFENLVVQQKVIGDSKLSVKDLLPGTKYFWRLRANNVCGVGEWSQAYSFTTGQIFCSNSLRSTEIITISDLRSDTITSKIKVDLSGIVRNVEIINVKGKHTWVKDLQFNLISPRGTIVNLIDSECGESDDFSLGFSDLSEVKDIPCPFTDGRLYQPSSNLSSFNGESASGDWTLQIIDLASQDGGQLEGWELSICSEISAEAIIYLGSQDLIVCNGSSATISIGLGTGFVGDVSLSLDNNGITGAFENVVVAPGSATELTLSSLDRLEGGNYDIIVNASDDQMTIKDTIKLTVESSITNVELVEPSNMMVDTDLNPILTWDDGGKGNSYFVQLSLDENFVRVVLEETLTTNSYEVDDDLLDELTEYYWRVASGNDCGAKLSSTSVFTTGKKTSTFQLENTQLSIYPNPASEVIKINVRGQLNSNFNIGLYDISGRIIRSDQLSLGKTYLELDTKDMMSGIYLLKLEGVKERRVEKIIIHN